jgi:hypothetical protein
LEDVVGAGEGDGDGVDVAGDADDDAGGEFPGVACAVVGSSYSGGNIGGRTSSPPHAARAARAARAVAAANARATAS